MFEQTFKNIDDILHKDAGCTSELDYTEQSSWLLFLKYLDALEADRAAEAELEGRAYSFILAEPFRWERWAAPRAADGHLDHHSALTGDDLRDFVNGTLFPYLAGFKQRASGPNTIEYKIGEVFGEIKNKVQSGYNLRDVIELVDQLRFRSQTEKHELSHLYEAKIKNMGNAGRNGGEYYTPRPLIRAMMESCKLHTVLDCPGGTFQGAGVKTVVLFFEKGAPTRRVWFYQLDPGRSLGKTNPLNDDDLADFIARQKTLADSKQSWSSLLHQAFSGQL